MSDQDALIRSILLCPNDDTPRMCLADFLEESGDTEQERIANAQRAEFIRVQVELARLEHHEQHIGQLTTADWYRRAELRRRERELWARHGTDWMDASLHKFNIIWQDRLIWSRGFISGIRCSWADFLRIEGKLIAGGTVECDNCEGDGEFTRENSDPPYGPCPNCGGNFWSGPYFEPSDYGWDKGSGRIPKPFVPSMQPVTRVELTDEPESYWRGGVRCSRDIADGCQFDRVEFTRAKCLKCDGRGTYDSDEYGNNKDGGKFTTSCWCRGRPRNSWTCDDWPGVEFVMPEEQRHE